MPQGKLLSNVQRSALMALPRANEDILIGQYYTFSEGDLAAIRKQRGPENQLGLPFNCATGATQGVSGNTKNPYQNTFWPMLHNN